MDTIFIEQLNVITTIGVYNWEQSIKQRLMIDIEMAWDNQRPAKSDDINDCLNYASVSNYVIDWLENRSFKLIERVAEELAEQIMQHFSVPKIKITVRKPLAVPQALSVGVTIEREKRIHPNH